MRNQRFFWWIFAAIGLISGLLVALVYVGGLAETWQPAGNPGTPIREIIGLADQSLYVRAENGRVYSFRYTNWKTVSTLLPASVEWIEENGAPLSPLPGGQVTTRYIIWPPLFAVRQLYALELPVPEGEFLAEFALSDDGNLWLWNHGFTGLAMLSYYIFPVLGAVLGLLFGVIVKVFRQFSQGVEEG